MGTFSLLAAFLEDPAVIISPHGGKLGPQGDNEGKESWDKYRERETVNRAVTDAKGTSREGPVYRAQLRKTTQRQPARDPPTGQTDRRTDI